MKTYKEWSAAYYPVSAHRKIIAMSSCNNALEVAIALTKHALQKWYGLRAAVLEEHQLVLNRGSLETADGIHAVLHINDGSCTLCIRYMNDSDDEDEPCVNCPLYETLNKPCDGDYSLYGTFIATKDPEPMIAALEETLTRLEAELKEEMNK